MKKIFIGLIIAILVIIAILIFITNSVNRNKKIIYYSYGRANGFLLIEEKITIYNDGTIEKLYKVENDEEIYIKSKLSPKELTKIREIATNIEKSELVSIIEDEGSVNSIISDYMDDMIYININKKIILKDNDVEYTNEHIEELDKCIGELYEKHLK